MVKIEKIYEGTSGSFLRDDRQVPIYTNQIISDAEFDSLVLKSGKILISINEQELREVEASPQQLTLNIESTVQAPVEQEAVTLEIKSEAAIEEVQLTVDETEETRPVVTPPIVKPAPRKK